MDCLTALMLFSTAAMAADDKAGKALQRAQQKAQSLEQEKNRLTAEKTQMQDDLKKAQDDASRVKSASAAKLGSVQKELASLQDDKQRLSDELAQLKAAVLAYFDALGPGEYSYGYVASARFPAPEDGSPSTLHPTALAARVITEVSTVLACTTSTPSTATTPVDEYPLDLGYLIVRSA